MTGASLDMCPSLIPLFVPWQLRSRNVGRTSSMAPRGKLKEATSLPLEEFLRPETPSHPVSSSSLSLTTMPPTTKEKEALLNPFPYKYRIPLIIFHVAQCVLFVLYAIGVVIPTAFWDSRLIVEGLIFFYVQSGGLLVLSFMSIAMLILDCIPSIPVKLFVLMYTVYACAAVVFFFLGGIEFPVVLMLLIGERAYKAPNHPIAFLFIEFFFSTIMTFTLNVMPVFVALAVRRLLLIRSGVIKA